MSENFIKAKNGGRNHGLYIILNNQTDLQLLKSISSYYKNVEEHRQKIKNPDEYINNWEKRGEQYKTGIIKKWEKDMHRNQEQLEVAIGIATERGRIL